MTSFISQLMTILVAVSIIGMMNCFFLNGRKRKKGIRRVADIKEQSKKKEYHSILNFSKNFNNDSNIKSDRTKIVPVGFFEICTRSGVEKCELELNEDYTFRIGSNPDYCDLVINSPYVSGVHAEVFFDEDENSYAIQDLDSLNGTYVGEEETPITAVYLEDGLKISLGKAVSIIYNHGYSLPTYESDVRSYESRKKENTIIVEKKG